MASTSTGMTIADLTKEIAESLATADGFRLDGGKPARDGVVAGTRDKIEDAWKDAARITGLFKP